MAESSKRKKRFSSRQHPSGETPAAIPPHSAALFSDSKQWERYSSNFSTREIIEPKYVSAEYFEDENFYCYEIFRAYGLLDFLQLRSPIYPELVRVFYNNLQIKDGVIYSEVKRIPIVIDQSLFFNLTKLSSDGECLEGGVPAEWTLDYDPNNARQMLCIENVSLDKRILAGLFKFNSRIMHYIIVRVLLPRSTNLAQATEEDIILMWALVTGRQVNWAHLIRYRMTKALRAKAPLPYAHLISLILSHFNMPLAQENLLPVKRSSAIGAFAISSFGYVKSPDGVWVRRRLFPDADDRTPSPPHRDETAGILTDLLDELRSFRVHVDERFDSLETRLARLEDSAGGSSRPADDA